MLMQFSTGSVEDRENNAIAVEVQNAGIQTSNVTCMLITKVGEREDVLTKKAKVGPRTKAAILRAELSEDEESELVLEVDSPSLIILLKSETRRPLHFRVITLTDRPNGSDSGEAKGVTLLCGYMYRGDPF